MELISSLNESIKAKLISWNVTGINRDDKRDIVRKLLHQWGADIYILVETKLERPIDGVLQSIWSNRWLGEFHKEAIGSSGRIIVLLDKKVWIGEMVEVGDQSITRKFTGVNKDFSWHITAVYADCNREIRKTLWEDVLLGF